MNHISKESLSNALRDIKTISAFPDHENISLVAAISKSTVLTTKENKQYLSVTLSDKTGTIDMPLWNDVELADELIVGTVVFVTGTKKTFNEKHQINKTSISICDGYSATDFIAKYNVALKSLIIELLSYIKKIQDKRYVQFLEEMLGIQLTDKLEIIEKEKWNAFLTCPAASKYHGNKIHGLLVHTIGVLRTVDKMIDLHSDFDDIDTTDAFDKDMLYFMTMIHDYCKLKEYKYDVAISRNDNLYVDHGVFLVGELQYVNRSFGNLFNDEEMSKMFFISLTHHGDKGRYTPEEWDKYPVEAKLLHCADMIDSQIVSEAEKIKVKK